MIEFDQGLHVITGETGAGKSIMLDALGLALGERAKTHQAKKAASSSKTTVEAIFDLSKLQLNSLFEDEELDYHHDTIIRREIAPNGRSRAFVNDTPCNLAFLQTLASHLIEVHQQFDQLALRESSFQYDVLDVLGQQKNEVLTYQKKYKLWLANQARLDEMKASAQQLQSEEDFLQFQFDELTEFDINESDDQLGETQTILSQAEEIQQTLGQAFDLIIDSDMAIMDQLQSLNQSLSSFQNVSQIHEIKVRLEEVMTELQDIGQTVLDVQEETEYDPQKLTEVEDRLATIFRLKKKHQAETAQQLIEKKDELEERLAQIQNSDSEIQHLEDQIKKDHQELQSLAQKISNKRSTIIPQFEEKVSQHLHDLGMPDAILQVARTNKELSENGIDQIDFLFSSNKGMAPSPIKLTASGGEISRLNLAIKSEVAGEMALPTIIFDEIDSGVSGEVARKIATLLEKLSLRHQIVCITHTPQIASSKATHFHVSKDSTGSSTHTVVTKLTPPQRLEKIAEILDGSPPSKEALENAKKLLARSPRAHL